MLCQVRSGRAAAFHTTLAPGPRLEHSNPAQWARRGRGKRARTKSGIVKWAVGHEGWGSYLRSRQGDTDIEWMDRGKCYFYLYEYVLTHCPCVRLVCPRLDCRLGHSRLTVTKNNTAAPCCVASSNKALHSYTNCCFMCQQQQRMSLWE